MFGRVKLDNTVLTCDQSNFNPITAWCRNRTLVTGYETRALPLSHQYLSQKWGIRALPLRQQQPTILKSWPLNNSVFLRYLFYLTTFTSHTLHYLLLWLHNHWFVQRQTLRAVPVAEVAYGWNDQNLHFWVYGSGLRRFFRSWLSTVVLLWLHYPVSLGTKDFIWAETIKCRLHYIQFFCICRWTFDCNFIWWI